MYQLRIETSDEMKKCIIQAIRSITLDMLRKSWQKLNYRLNMCRATRTTHFEPY